MTSVSPVSGEENVQPPAVQSAAVALVSATDVAQKGIKRRRLTVLSDNKDASSGALVGQAPTPSTKPQTSKPLVDAQAKAMQPPAPKSMYTGVHWNKSKRKWRVRLKTHGRDTHIGYYALERDAALAYDRAVRENIVDYTQDVSVRLNFPSELEAAAMVKGKPSRSSRAGSSAVKSEPKDISMKDMSKKGTVFEEINKHADEPRMSGAARCSEYCANNRLSPLLNTAAGEPSASELPSPGTRDSSCSTPSMPFGPSMTQMNYVKSEVVHSKGVHAARSAGGIESLQRVVKHIEFHDSREASPVSSVSSGCDDKLEFDAVSALIALSDSPAKPDAPMGEDGTGRKRKRVVKRKLRPELLSRSDEEMAGFQQGSMSLAHMHHDMSPGLPYSHNATSIPSGPCDVERQDSSTRGTWDKEQQEPAHCRSAMDAGVPRGSRGGSPSSTSSFPFSRRSQSFRGVTWDKMKKMWRVRVCLAGGGREHVGYFIDEAEGAKAYQIALEKLRSRQEQKAAEQEANKADGVEAKPEAAKAHAPNPKAQESNPSPLPMAVDA